jgi:hypothetical protein
MIFVFGSNQAGIHGAGAALFAVKDRGARYGNGEGIQGNSYAIPTKDSNLIPRTLFGIKKSADKFIKFAKENPDKTFQVTRIGCGYAGYTNSDIAPMFTDAPPNCCFDRDWKDYLPNKKFWN